MPTHTQHTHSTQQTAQHTAHAHTHTHTHTTRSTNAQLEERIIEFEASDVARQRNKGSELALNVVHGIRRRHFGKTGFIADTLQESVEVHHDVSSSSAGGGGPAAFAVLDLDLDFPYTFFYLRRLVGSSSSSSSSAHADEIYSQIQTLLKTYPARTMMMSPQRIQQVCLKLLFLLLEFVAVRPPRDLSLLKSLKVAVKTFYFWPRPYVLASE